MRDFNSRRLLFDTNVLLDAMVVGRPQSKEAWAVLDRCNGGGDVGLATCGSLKDVYFILSRGGKEAEARETVEKLRELLVIAPNAPASAFFIAEAGSGSLCRSSA